MAKKKKENKNWKNAEKGEKFGSFLKLIFNVFFKYTGLGLVIIYGIFGLILYLKSKVNPFLKFDSIPHIWFNIGLFLVLLICIIIIVRNLIVKPMKGVVKGFRQPVWKKQEDDSSSGQDDFESEKTDLQIRDSKGRLPTARQVRKAKKERKKLEKQVKNTPMQEYQEESVDYGFEPISMNQNRPQEPYIEQVAYNPYSNNPAPVPTSYSSPKEEPKIYMSALEPNILIHEYSDRFEVYRMINGRAIRDRIEFKNR